MRKGGCRTLPALAAALLALGAGAAQAQIRASEVRGDPGKLVAAELALARTVQEKGQWSGLAQYAAKDAVLFEPQPVDAQRWLKGRANPTAATKRQPHQVWASCDGSLAVTKGAWQQVDGSFGYFTTAWARQRDGSFKWVLDQEDSLSQPLAEPEMIGGSVAQCPVRSGPGGARGKSAKLPVATISPPACDGGQCRGGGASADGTLSYVYSVAASGARQLSVHARQDGTMHEVLRSDVTAQ